MSVIDIKNLTFAYAGSGDNVFENVSLRLDTDWKLGLVGRNGKGKTTLLRLLAGGLEYSGEIKASVAFEYFPYFAEDKDLTAYEIVAGIDPCGEEWKIRRELGLLGADGLDLFRPFAAFSNGEQTKILLAALFAKDNTFLLIDEPTNHLDRAGRQALAKYLGGKSSYILVSHDRRFLDGCIDHVMSINRANIEVESGDLSTYLANKRRRDDREAAENEKLKAEIKRLKEAGRRAAAWSDKVEKTKYGGKQANGLRPDRGAVGAKSAKMMKRAVCLKNRMEDSLAEKSALLKNVDRKDAIAIVGADFFKETLIAVKDLAIAYDGRPVNSPLSFEVRRGERVSLVGKNGSGKTSVLKAILGQLAPQSGTVEYNKQLKISYVPQDTAWLRGTPDEFCAVGGVDKTAFIVMLNKLGFERGQVEKRLEDMSEGQRKKALIARSLCEQPHVFIWDEPLNYIDIISREQIRSMLAESNVTMIFVEHDADFCDAVATKEVYIG